jgi:hypothetical protein
MPTTKLACDRSTAGISAWASLAVDTITARAPLSVKIC